MTELLVIPEVIADSLTTDKGEANYLAARAKRHWQSSASFRESFKGCDERDQMQVWMEHWLKSLRERQRKGLQPA